ncbi:hypothetical protein N9I89_04085 [Porticoccaceae bacterium]|nr:hypothetical protein [Porticoccaceae bacterium]
MKTFNKTLIAAATLTTFGLAAAPAAVALDASASIATSYLWRGTELGQGSAALAVDLSGSTGAISYGLWVSSGDGQDGLDDDGVLVEGSTEYDIYASYGGSVGEIGYSIGYASYNYPTAGVGFDDNAEYIYGLSYGPASVTVYDAKGGDYEYTVVGYEAGAFSFAYGDNESTTHFDVSYAVNDSLTLTVSEPEDAETIVAASYALPF